MVGLEPAHRVDCVLVIDSGAVGEVSVLPQPVLAGRSPPAPVRRCGAWGTGAEPTSTAASPSVSQGSTTSAPRWARTPTVGRGHWSACCSRRRWESLSWSDGRRSRARGAGGRGARRRRVRGIRGRRVVRAEDGAAGRVGVRGGRGRAAARMRGLGPARVPPAEPDEPDEPSKTPDATAPTPRTTATPKHDEQAARRAGAAAVAADSDSVWKWPGSPGGALRASGSWITRIGIVVVMSLIGPRRPDGDREPVAPRRLDVDWERRQLALGLRRPGPVRQARPRREIRAPVERAFGTRPGAPGPSPSAAWAGLPFGQPFRIVLHRSSRPCHAEWQTPRSKRCGRTRNTCACGRQQVRPGPLIGASRRVWDI